MRRLVDDGLVRLVGLSNFGRAKKNRTAQSQVIAGMEPFDWFEDPVTTPRPSPIEPNWRKVLFVLAATAIVIGLALAVGAVIR
jgi:hypothetical protein